MTNRVEVLSFVTVKVSVSAKVEESVLDSFQAWVAQNYGDGVMKVEVQDAWTELTFHIDKIYNPYKVAKRAGKKVVKLLNASS